MDKFTVFTAVAAPYEKPNVDTDQLLPARFLRRPRSEGYQTFLFRDLRYNDDNSEKPDFVLNQAPYRKAGIMVADRAFGGGSSREQAVWALTDSGIRSVIASSFGDIFYNNAFKNGFLPVRLDQPLVEDLRAQLLKNPGAKITIDLDKQTVLAPDGKTHSFDIGGFHKQSMLLGLDEVGVTLLNDPEISTFEGAYKTRRPWMSAPPRPVRA